MTDEIRWSVNSDDTPMSRYVVEPCPLCEEPVTLEQLNSRTQRIGGMGGNRIAHRECLLRSALGGMGHLENHAYWCTEQHDPDGGRSYRQSALEVDDWVAAHGVDAGGGEVAVSAQWVTIPPDSAPGLLFVRITALNRLLREGPLVTPTAARERSESDVALAERWCDEHGETVWVHIYDGDSGVCVKTIIVHPEHGAN